MSEPAVNVRIASSWTGIVEWDKKDPTSTKQLSPKWDQNDPTTESSEGSSSYDGIRGRRTIQPPPDLVRNFGSNLSFRDVADRELASGLFPVARGRGDKCRGGPKHWETASAAMASSKLGYNPHYQMGLGDASPGTSDEENGRPTTMTRSALLQNSLGESEQAYMALMSMMQADSSSSVQRSGDADDHTYSTRGSSRSSSSSGSSRSYVSAKSTSTSSSYHSGNDLGRNVNSQTTSYFSCSSSRSLHSTSSRSSHSSTASRSSSSSYSSGSYNQGVLETFRSRIGVSKGSRNLFQHPVQVPLRRLNANAAAVAEFEHAGILPIEEDALSSRSRSSRSTASSSESDMRIDISESGSGICSWRMYDDSDDCGSEMESDIESILSISSPVSRKRRKLRGKILRVMTVFVSIAAFCGLIYVMTEDDLDARSVSNASTRNLFKIPMDGAAATAGNNGGVFLDNSGGTSQQHRVVENIDASSSSDDAPAIDEEDILSFLDRVRKRKFKRLYGHQERHLEKSLEIRNESLAQAKAEEERKLKLSESVALREEEERRLKLTQFVALDTRYVPQVQPDEASTRKSQEHAQHQNAQVLAPAVPGWNVPQGQQGPLQQVYQGRVPQGQGYVAQPVMPLQVINQYNNAGFSQQQQSQVQGVLVRTQGLFR